MIKELENKIGQLQYEISLLGLDSEELTGITIRTDELKDLVKNLSITDVVASKLNRWVKIDPTKANTIPEEPVWIITLDSKEIEYKEADEFIELNYASHYRLIDKPKPLF